MVKDGKYVNVLKLLLERKIVELMDTKPLEINELFALEKYKTEQSLILDARWATLLRRAGWLSDALPRATQLHMKIFVEKYVGELCLDN